MKNIVWIICLLCGTLVGQASSTRNVTAEARVLILGAGISGISAARTLDRAGEEDFLILEASDRIGGRTKQATIGGYTIQTGSSWIQGTNPNHASGINPIYDYALRLNLTVRPSNYDDWIVRNSTGHDVTDEADTSYESFASALYVATNMSFRMLTGDEPFIYQPDLDFNAALRKYGWKADDPITWVNEYFDVDFTTGNMAALSSLKFYFDYAYYNYEDEDLLVIEQEDGGFVQIHQALMDEIISDNDSVQKLYLNQLVTSIEEEDGKVYVTSASGDTFMGDYAIITFSIGVLQHEVVQFVPPLPDWKMESIHSFDMSPYTILYLKFDSAITPFWDDNEWIVFASERRGFFTLWQNVDLIIPGSRLLQVTLSGAEALNIERMSDQEVQSQAMDALRSMYGNSIPDPVDIVFSRWSYDPLFYGSFPNWPPGFEAWQMDALKSRVGKLHFAGDALNEMYGYLQGAYFSGEETANEVLTCMTKKRKCKQEFVPPYAARGCTYRDADNYDRAADVDDGSCTFSVRASSASQLQSALMLFLLPILILL